jgi:NAD+ kinase
MKKILFYPNPVKDFSIEVISSVLSYLLSLNLQIVVPNECKHHISPEFKLTFLPLADALSETDMVLTFGGDGTILHVAAMCAKANKPILGINAGHIGFMTELELSEMNEMKRLITAEYSIDKRMMLDVEVLRENQVFYKGTALNDVILTKGNIFRIIDITVLIGKKEVLDFDGDGIVVCTPTGSTAYSLSAGGPIIEPCTENIIITPICPHVLHVKPFVISTRHKVTVKTGKLSGKAAFLSLDGGESIQLLEKDSIQIKKSSYQTSLIRFKNDNFYNILSIKLSYGGR